ncbi:ATP synthase F0 complex subunit a [Candidatus Bealeia paramacronuclearis]|uniref:ATP synthase subunit a n=1 Tax=Candidatus Bealeia paramacronuclearis TaxID=1921001 RepID=A0ABZ2C6S4_9PROT|nr:ATP synthase F0 complex subunit a [Candidatus Bealeia paramacronuclearis]
MADPLHQFEIHTIMPLQIAGIDVSFTNSSLFMVLAVFASTLFLVGGMMKSKAIPGRWQGLSEMTYEFVASLLNENVGPKGRSYFPLIFTVFIFILMGNLLGMVPYSFTYTSHIIVTFGLAMLVFLAVTLIGIFKHGFHFFSLFFPKGAPVFMAPIIIPIEILSYLSRPVSLSVRLFANMMAGHTMLKVFAGFTVALGLFGVAPLVVNTALTAFEVMVALLQAYVFTILTCIYLHDAIHLH